MNSSPRVVDHIVDRLVGYGIGHIFGVDGANIEDLYDAAAPRDGLTAVLAKHEFSAATMADGYCRSGASLGVVAATSGGGCLNLVAGLAESYASGIPVLALVGQPPSALDGHGSFQDTSGHNGALDAQALFAAVSVYCRRILEPGDIVDALPAAVAAARRGGPAVLLLPKDIQQSRINTAGGEVPDCAYVGDPAVLAERLRHARGPVTIIAGQQVARDDARDELERLRATLRARVATEPDAKDVSGAPGLGSSSALGIVGVMGHPGVAEVIADSAVCLLVGTRLPVTARAGLDAALAPVSVLSIGSATPHVPSVHVRTEDLRASLALLNAALSGAGRPVGITVPESIPHRELDPPAHRGPGIRYRDAITALDRALPDGTDVVVDAGNGGASAIHLLPVRRGGRFLVALGMGGMGYSFGAGIGMCFARRRRTVIIAGDGSFFMHGLELHTAIQYRLPVTLVLFNNNSHAMCVTREQLFYGDRYSYNRFTESRLGAGLAAMFPGLPSQDVDDPAVLPDALRAALDADGPSVLSIGCSADEIPTFAPFLTTQEVGAHVPART